jgi:hypothetical protein
MDSWRLPRSSVAAHSRSSRKVHLESLCTRVYVWHEHPGGWQRRADMWDAIMLAVAVAFFALAITYASGIDRM